MLKLLSRSRAAAPARKLPPAIAASRERFSLNKPLLAWSKYDAMTVRDSFESVLIAGGVGSAKTTASGRTIARSLLNSGYGGLVLCAKADERDVWLRYAAETGREKSVILFDGSGRHSFNPLDYEARRGGPFDARSVVNLLMTMVEAASGGEGATSGDNKLWTDLTRELATNVVQLLHSAWGTVTLADIMRVVDSAPQTVAQANEAAWQADSFCFQSIVKMLSDPANRIAPEDENVIGEFFRGRWARRHDKMRTSIEANLSASVYPFLTGQLRPIFSGKTTVVPEMAHEGAILIIDLPAMTHGAAGILAQHVWKYMFQRATQRRNSQSPYARPVFVWADECQYFLSSYDREFLGTSRGAKCCSVYITQNLPTLYSEMKGPNSRDTVNALLGNFQTKIFHQNTDADTNKFASDIVGKQWQWVENVGRSDGSSTSEGEARGSNAGGTSGSTGGAHGSSYSSTSGSSKTRNRGTGTNSGTSSGAAQQLHEELLPSTFTTLRKGGGPLPPEAIVIRGGKPFDLTGRSWLRCQFSQKG